MFPLSGSKKRKIISDSEEEVRSDDQKQQQQQQLQLDLSPEQLVIQHAQTVHSPDATPHGLTEGAAVQVSQLRMEKMKSKQKDDYVRFIRSAQQSKNDVIRSLQRENCTLQQVKEGLLFPGR